MEEVTTFEEPKILLEQYPTTPHIAGKYQTIPYFEGLSVTNYSYTAGKYQTTPHIHYCRLISKTAQSFYNTPHYNTDSNITWSCCGSQIFYHGVLQMDYKQNDHNTD